MVDAQAGLDNGQSYHLQRINVSQSWSRLRARMFHVEQEREFAFAFYPGADLFLETILELITSMRDPHVGNQTFVTKAILAEGGNPIICTVLPGESCQMFARVQRA